jgi:two-component system chemotaxis response regulator CheB
MARVVVIGGSAGGIEAVRTIVKSLQPGLHAAVLVVIHLPASAHSVLPKLLANANKYPATHPRDGEPLQSGHIYIAPPNYHLLVEHGVVRVTLGPRENRHRPAIDPLFRSAARAYGKDVMGIVLSGSDSDGSIGLAEIKQRGGITVAQAPTDASYTIMPQSAINHTKVDWVLPVAEIGPLINRLMGSKEDEPAMNSDPSNQDARQLEEESCHEDVENSKPSAYSCPDCGGVLWEVDDGEFVRFRCRVGHGFTPDGLLSAQSDELERALWESLKALEERSSLLHRLSRRMAERMGREGSADSFDRAASEMDQHAVTIRRLLYQSELFDATEHTQDAEDPPLPHDTPAV